MFDGWVQDLFIYLHDLARCFLDWMCTTVVLCGDPAQPIMTAGAELDDLSADR